MKAKRHQVPYCSLCRANIWNHLCNEDNRNQLCTYRNQVTANICNGYGKTYIPEMENLNQIERLQIPLLNNADEDIPWADSIFEDNRKLMHEFRDVLRTLLNACDGTFGKIVNVWKLWTIVGKSSVRDVWQVLKHACVSWLQRRIPFEYLRWSVLQNS